MPSAQVRGADDPWLTVEEAADRARCSVWTIKQHAQSGRLYGTKISGKKRGQWRFRRSWVDNWLESGRVQ